MKLNATRCRTKRPQLLLMLIASCLPLHQGFTSSPTFSSRNEVSRDRTSLEVGDLLGGLFSNQEKQDPKKPTRVIDIPCKNVKVGGLKFFLGIYLVGEQNKPKPGSWKTNNVDENINLYYTDGTAMCSIGFAEYAITVDRYGSAPSLEYVLQESILLHGLLDEINKLAFEMDDIEEENRLVRLMAPGDAIDKAREKLPARKEQDK